MKTPPSNIPPVPEGFEYCCEGTIPFPLENPSTDIIRWSVQWYSLPWDLSGWSGKLPDGYHALRIGSEVHRKNMPKPEVEWRMLREGEEIQEGDEHETSTPGEWKPATITKGHTYKLQPGWHKPHRRRVQPQAAPETYWWPLWKHMSEAHGLTLLDDECVQIARAVDEVRAKDAKADTDAVAACDAWVKLFVELGRALGMEKGTGNDVLAEVKRRVQSHVEVVAAFDVARSALAIVRKERDEKAEQLQIALREKKMLSNAIRNAANVEANLSKQ